MRPHGRGSKYRKFIVEYKGIIQILKFSIPRGKNVRNVQIYTKFEEAPDLLTLRFPALYDLINKQNIRYYLHKRKYCRIKTIKKNLMQYHFNSPPPPPKRSNFFPMKINSL